MKSSPRTGHMAKQQFSLVMYVWVAEGKSKSFVLVSDALAHTKQSVF